MQNKDTSKDIRFPSNEKALDYFCKRLEDRLPFAYSRFGDGEWYALLGYLGQNCDGSRYTKTLGTALRRAIKNSWKFPFFYALGSQATTKLGAEIDRFLQAHKVEITWHNAEVWVWGSIHGKLGRLVRVLRDRDMTYVGPDGLRPTVKRFFGDVDYVVIPEQDCFSQHGKVLKSIEKSGNSVVGFSAGMATNGMIDKLWEISDGEVTLLDFGSVFDPYTGRLSRSYMRKGNYDFAALEERHLSGIV